MLRTLYREYDYVVQSPTSKAFGKVPIEGYFHGLIPLLSNTCILADYITDSGKRGFIFNLKEECSLLEVLKHLYYEFPNERKIQMINDGREFVKKLTINEWAKTYIEKIRSYYPQ